MIINTNKCQAVTRYIKHLAESANFKGCTLNEYRNGLIGNRFEMPNVSYTYPLATRRKKRNPMIGQCKLGGIYFVFFLPRSKKETPTHIATHLQAHEPTPKPKACKRVAILPTHSC